MVQADLSTAGKWKALLLYHRRIMYVMSHLFAFETPSESPFYVKNAVVYLCGHKMDFLPTCINKMQNKWPLRPLKAPHGLLRWESS